MTFVHKIIDIMERILVALLAIPFIFAFTQAASVRPEVLLLLVSELLAVAMILIRKRGPMVMTPYAFIVGLVGAAGPLLVRPSGGPAVVPEIVGTVLMLGGLGFNISAKLFLNRSFGMVAANRGVKRGGPYKLVRHPMYLGYTTTQLGFLLMAFSLTNFSIYVLLWTVQVLRIFEEERCLMQDEQYRIFATATRWRVIPGLF